MSKPNEVQTQLGDKVLTILAMNSGSANNSTKNEAYLDKKETFTEKPVLIIEARPTESLEEVLGKTDVGRRQLEIIRSTRQTGRLARETAKFKKSKLNLNPESYSSLEKSQTPAKINTIGDDDWKTVGNPGNSSMKSYFAGILEDYLSLKITNEGKESFIRYFKRSSSPKKDFELGEIADVYVSKSLKSLPENKRLAKIAIEKIYGTLSALELSLGLDRNDNVLKQYKQMLTFVKNAESANSNKTLNKIPEISLRSSAKHSHSEQVVNYNSLSLDQLFIGFSRQSNDASIRTDYMNAMRQRFKDSYFNNKDNKEHLEYNLKLLKRFEELSAASSLNKLGYASKFSQMAKVYESRIAELKPSKWMFWKK